MKKFFIITFFISSLTYALNCNPNYLASSKDSIVLSSEDTIIKNSLNKIIKQKELLLNDGEFVVVQNISLGSDSINIDPKINSSEYTVNHLNNLKKMETMVEKGEIILPDYIKKDDFFIFNKSLQNSIEIFLADSNNSKNLNLFNSFLYQFN